MNRNVILLTQFSQVC